MIGWYRLTREEAQMIAWADALRRRYRDMMFTAREFRQVRPRPLA